MKENPAGAAPQFIDSTPNSKNGTVAAGPYGGGSISTISGKIGDGVNNSWATQYLGNHVSTPGPSGMGTGDRSIEGWVNLNSTFTSDGNSEVLFGGIRGSYPWGYYTLYVRDNGKLYGSIDHDGDLTPDGTTLVPGTWYHIAMTKSGSSVKVYLNGNLESTTITTVPVEDTNGFFIGPENIYGASTKLDEIKISGTARSADWIATEYNNQNNPTSFFSLGSSGSVPVIDTTPPVLSGITAGSITSIGATISWTTDENTDSQVEYGTTNSYGSSSALNSAMATLHNVTLSSFTPNTLYHYRVRSSDASGNLAVSIDKTFTTAAAVDTTPPIISVSNPVSGSTVAGAAVTILASAADDVGVAGVQFKLDGNNLGAEDTDAPFSVSWNTTGAVNASHTLTAVARDSAGNIATSPAVSVTVNNGIISTPSSGGATSPIDTTPPVISGIIITDITKTSAMISFNTNENSTAVVEYGTTTGYGNKLPVSITAKTSHAVILSGLTPDAIYHFNIQAKDVSSNLAVSDDKVFTTLGAITPQPILNPLTVTQYPNTGTVTFPTGTLLNDKGTIYLIIQKNRVPFSSLTAFTRLGYSLKNVVVGNSSGYRLVTAYVINSPTMEHPWSSWLNKNGTVYYATAEGMVPVPSMDVLLKNGGLAKYILPMNAKDRAQLAAHRSNPVMYVSDPRVMR